VYHGSGNRMIQDHRIGFVVGSKPAIAAQI
jgi:hypothetical protein